MFRGNRSNGSETGYTARTYEYWCASNKVVANDPNIDIPLIRPDDTRVRSIDAEFLIQEHRVNCLPRKICFFRTKNGHTWDEIKHMAHVVQPLKGIVAELDSFMYDAALESAKTLAVDDKDEKDDISSTDSEAQVKRKTALTCTGLISAKLHGLGSCETNVEVRKRNVTYGPDGRSTKRAISE